MVVLANNFNPAKITNSCLPINLLTEAATTHHSSQLVVKSNDVTWSIYFERGRVSYGTNSLTSIERLERHLRFLKKDPALLKQIIRRQLEFFAGKQNSQGFCDKLECQSIYWLFKNSLISAVEAATLTKRITEESLELFLLLGEEEISDHQILKISGKSPILCSLELGLLIKKLAQRLDQWHSLQPYVHSPYQRLYCGVTPSGQLNQRGFQQRFSKLLRGLSFRQLAALCSQDELQLAQKLLPSVQQGEIILADPLPPHDWPSNQYDRRKFTGAAKQPDSAGVAGNQPSSPVAIARTWQIVCVDDSPTILEEVNRILANPSINLTKVQTH
ncbi:MAG: hypothetical protein HC890_11500 [Chloroflexaceae bacterium]|nr:hypothetical protein [Chloroflexaceae bacterium]